MMEDLGGPALILKGGVEVHGDYTKEDVGGEALERPAEGDEAVVGGGCFSRTRRRTAHHCLRRRRKGMGFLSPRCYRYKRGCNPPRYKHADSLPNKRLW